MNWRTTWFLLTLALALFAFIYLVERHTRSTSFDGERPARLLSVTPAEVTSIQLRRTNQFVLHVERTNDTWNLTAPLVYPAQVLAIESLLQTLADLVSPTSISAAELNASQKTIAEFGLDVPLATLTLQHAGRRTEILFGSKTTAGDQVYVQLLNSPSIYVINSDLFDHLPRGPNDWRDTSLLSVGGLNLDRMEVRLPGRSFAINLDATNKAFYFSKPMPARADTAKVEALLRKIQAGRVVQFVSDDARAELEAYGLQPPEAELVFGFGTNDLAVVQLGKSPTNDSTVVYARRLGHNNVVLVPKIVLEALQVSPADLRDRHLLSFSPDAVDTVEVVSPEAFAVRRQFNGLWVVLEPQATLVDSELMRELTNRLLRLEGNVEKDVVTDFASYGLATPARQYLLKSTVTNAAGMVTNRIVAQLDIGVRQDDKIFARRPEEGFTVYSISPSDFEFLPLAAWQLRDRRVWSFTTNQVSRVSIRHNGYTRQLVRSAAGEWSFASGSQGVIKNTFALEETMYRLGELRAVVWVARGDENRARYGFTDDGHRLTIELTTGGKPYLLNLEFGGFSSTQLNPYAMTTVDGQNWIFEFPLPLFKDVMRDLSNPPPRASAGL